KLGNESATISTTVGNQSQRWIAQVYRDLLKREVRPPELVKWTRFLNQPGNPSEFLAKIAQTILNSQEYRIRAIQDIYLAYLGHLASPTALRNPLALLNAGGTFEQIRGNVLGSVVYFQLKGGTNATWAAGLYQDVLGRPIHPAELKAEASALKSGATRHQRA